MKHSLKQIIPLVLSAGFAASLCAQPRTITNQLVVHLTFDNTLADNSGRGNNGTYDSHNGLVNHPASPTYVGGKLGQAFQFTTAVDASTIDFVTLGYPADLKFADTNSWTVSFWINNTNNVGDPAMISNKNWWAAANHGWGVFFQNGGNFRVQMTDSGTGANLGGTRPEVIRDGAWHHIAVSFTVGGTRNIYLDGALINSVPHNFTGSTDTDDLLNGEGAPYAVNIGEDGTGAYNDSVASPPPPTTGGDSGVINGKIDDVGFWRRALTDLEVANIYNFGQLGTNLYNVPDVHTPIIQSFAPANGAVGVAPNIPTEADIVDQDSAVNTNTMVLTVDGVTVINNGVPVVPGTGSVVKNGTNTTVKYTKPTPLFAPLTTHTNKITFSDNASPTPHVITKTDVYTIAGWQNIYLPTPLYFENFDELSLATNAPPTVYPAGWTANNCTSPASAAGTWDLFNERSDTYLDWVIINIGDASNTAYINNGDNFNNIAQPYVVNCQPVTVLGSNNIAMCVSDGRSGSQLNYLFTGDYNLTGQTNIYVYYHSIYIQNQDSLGSLEYSTNQGSSWLPIVYMLNGNQTGTNGDISFSHGGPDVVTNLDGSVDGYSTFANLHDDAAFCADLNDGNYYGFFIGVDSNRWSTLGPYVQGRLDDNQTESCRIEFYRLPQADNQAKVRFRFAQAGTDSWDWGIDSFGIYSIPAATAPQITSVTKNGNNITINWNATGANACSGLQKATSGSAPVWVDIPNTIGVGTYTEAIAAGAGQTRLYRAVRF